MPTLEKLMPVLESPKSLARTIAIRDLDQDRDLLIVQTRGLEGKWPVGRIRARLLGLSGPGTSQVLASGNFIVRRLVGGLEPFVQTRLLALPTSAELADAVRVRADPDMIPRRYEAEGQEALQFDIAAGERLNVEPAEGFFSMAWSTALPVETLLQRLEAFLPESARARLTVGVDDGFEEISEPASLAVHRLLESGDGPGFWRLDLPDRTITWELRGAPSVEYAAPPPIPDAPPQGLMGFMAEVFDPDYMARLIEATATPMIGANVGSLLSECSSAIMAAHVSRDALAAG